MKKISYIFFLIFNSSFLILNSSFAQPTADEQLANQFFINKEYDKAVVYYEKVYSKKPFPPYYTNYLACLLQTHDFKVAEKLVKKQVKLNPTELNYIVDQGMVYIAMEQPDKAKSEFEKAIKQLNGDQDQVINLAQAFIKLKEWDYAISTYMKGRRLVGNIYPFNMELAEVYESKGDVSAMVNEYLEMLDISPGYLQSVQNALQTSFGADADVKKNEILKTQLLKRVQQEPDKTIFSEMLAWMFMQQKEFDSALTQYKAIDKRNREDGTRVMNLAQTSATNQNYDVAIKAYKYVIEKGSDNYNYVNARMEMIDAMYKKVVNQNSYTQADLLDLESNYNKALTELGKSVSTVPLIKGLAHLQAFYLHKDEDAIKLLEEAASTPQLNSQTQAECKLELGDILLMSGDIWEASLKYSQVEKAFKYDVVGHEAKFRNAKISFYNGDFKWSQTQLDVLKGSTSKLISNDAMALSIMISDAIDADSNLVPLWMYSRADLLEFQNKDEIALKVLDSILTKFPAHNLCDDVYYKKYKIMMKESKYDSAAKDLQVIIDKYPFDILGDDALFDLAELNETKLNNQLDQQAGKQKAMDLYQEVLVKYPGSLYTVEARKRFRRLRGDNME